MIISIFAILFVGELLKRARSKIAEDGYNFKKGFSRSLSNTSSSASDVESVNGNTTMKRKHTSGDDRKQAIANTRELLETTKSQIGIKQQRIQKQKNCNDFKKCDELTSEMRGLLKEKAELESRLAALERREAKSKWYKKKKTGKSQQSEKNEESVLQQLLRAGNTASKPSATGSDESGDTVILGDTDREDSSDNSNL